MATFKFQIISKVNYKTRTSIFVDAESKEDAKKLAQARAYLVNRFPDKWLLNDGEKV